MRVVVTGSAGFIGRATVTALEADGHAVVRFDTSNGHDVRDDLAVDKMFRGADAVIHLAGVLGTSELFDQAQQAVTVNVGGAVNVLDACKRHGLAYVGISMPDCWPSLYQATKLAGVRIAAAYQHAHGVPVTHVRAFNAYGPGQAHGPGHPQKIVPTFAAKAWAGEAMPIWGDGSQTVDLVHVDHIASCLATAAVESVAGTFGFGQAETWDAGSGLELSVLDVARLVGARCGSTRVEFLPMRAGELDHTRLCATEPGPFPYDLPAVRVGGIVDPRLTDTIDAYAAKVAA